MFSIVHDAVEFKLSDVKSVVEVISMLRDTSVTVIDQRPDGKRHDLVIEASGVVHEMYGSRLIIRDVWSLLGVPGKPVYS